MSDLSTNHRRFYVAPLVQGAAPIDTRQPDPTQFSVEDFVASLSRLPRFAGAGVTVAQHLVSVARWGAFDGAPEAVVRQMIAHDVHERIVADVSYPAKDAMRNLDGEDVRSAYDQLEGRAWVAVAAWLDVDPEMSPTTIYADRVWGEIEGSVVTAPADGINWGAPEDVSDFWFVRRRAAAETLELVLRNLVGRVPQSDWLLTQYLTERFPAGHPDLVRADQLRAELG